MNYTFEPILTLIQKTKIMKLKFNQLITIIAIFLFTGLLHHKTLAQSEFGVIGGVNVTGINKDYSGLAFDFETRTGGILGVYYKKYGLIGPVAFQGELLYQQKGGIFKFNHVCDDGYNYGYVEEENRTWLIKNQRYHYLTMPLLLSFSPTKFLDIYAGPELGYMIGNTSAKYTGWESNKFSAGITAGVGLKIDQNTNLNIRYSNDLTRVADFGDTDIKNYGWSFTIQRALFKKMNKNN